MKRLLTVLSAIATLVMIPGLAMAHDPGLSGIRIILNSGNYVVSVTTHISRLLKADHLTGNPKDPELVSALSNRLKLKVDGKSYRSTDRHLILDRANDMIILQSTASGTPKTWEFGAKIYPDDSSSTTVCDVVQNGKSIYLKVLTGGRTNAPTQNSAGSVVFEFLKQGTLHILGGPDHIAFVLGLLLLGGTIKALAKTVTSFTVAHSITLSLAALNICNPSPKYVEPLIALSIVAIAIENFRSYKNRSHSTTARDYRPIFAFVFGLIHGFGFAGALSEVGLPQNALVPALASFNIGVEFGQMGIVMLVTPILGTIARRNAKLSQWLIQYGSAAIGVAGAYWFVLRIR